MIQKRKEADDFINKEYELQDAPRYGVPMLTIATFVFVICILPVTFTPNGSWTGTVFTCIISAAMFTFLYTTTRTSRKYKWLFFLPVVPYLVALIVTRNPLMSAEALAFYPVSAAFIIALKKKFTYTTTVITASAALIVLYAVYMLISIVTAYGALNSAVLELLWDDLTTPMRDAYLQMTVMSEGREIKLYSPEQVNTLINTIILYIPATVICVTNVIAYLSVTLYGWITRLFRIQRFLTPYPAWTLELSVVSAYIYCAAYLIITFSGNPMAIIPVVAANILVILTPGFTFIGLRNLIRKFKSGKARKSAIILAVLSVIFLVISPSMIFYIMSLMGVIDTLIDHHTTKRTAE